MLVSKIRKRMKLIIWFIVIAFTISIFFVGAASFLENWSRKDQDNRRAQSAGGEVQTDPEFDVQSDNLLAQIRLDGEAAVITEGQLNRRLFSSSLIERFRTLPDQYRSVFKDRLLAQLINEELMIMEGQKQEVNVASRVLGQLEKLRQQSGSDKNFLAQLKQSGWKGMDQFKSFITRSYIIDEMRSRLFQGVQVSDEDIEFYYKINPKEFLDENGKPRKIDEVRAEIRNKLRSQVSDDSLQTYYQAHRWRWKQPRKVDFRYLVLNRADPKGKKEIEKSITEKDVQEYYEVNPDQFLTPEIVDLQHIYLDKEEIKKGIKPDEKELESYYEAHLEDFKVDEQAKASHILIKTESEDSQVEASALAEVTRIRDEVSSSKISFEDAAKKHSQDYGSAVNGGDLGLFPRGTMVPAFDEYCFSGPIGEVSQPIKTRYGYHIIRVDEREQAREKPLAEVREKVLDGVLDEALKNEAEVLTTSIDAQIKKGITSFSDLVANYSHAPSKAQSGVLKEVYLGPGNTEAVLAELSSGGTGIDYPIQVTLKALRAGDVSEMVETSGGYHFLKLQKKIEPRVKPLEHVTDAVRGKLLAQRLNSSFLERGKSLRASLKSTYVFQDLITKHSDSKLEEPTQLIEGLAVSSETSLASHSPEIALELGDGTVLADKVQGVLKYLRQGEVSRPIKLDDREVFLKVEKDYGEEFLAFDSVKSDVVEALTLNIGEEEIQEYFKANSADFAVTEKIVLQQIAYPKEDQGQAQLAQLLDGSLEFDAAGKSYLNMDRSSFIKNNGSVVLSEASFDEATKQKIKALPVGKILPILAKSPFGFHVVKMAEKTEASEGDLDSVRSEIIKTLQEEKRNEILQVYGEELRNRAEDIVIF